MRSAVYLFNTLTGTKDEVLPNSQGQTTVYACGPTVYERSHIGNMRAFTFADILVRTLILAGHQVRFVMNITDVGHLTSDNDSGEDKLAKSARIRKKTAWEIASLFEAQFMADIKALSFLPAQVYPRASEHIEEMKQMVWQLEKGGYTYKISDGIYFDTSKLANYHQLIGAKAGAKIKTKARVEENPEKRQIADFALWKFSPKSKKRDMEWRSVWGKGFPGWHIECSAMSARYLGLPISVHTGGVDHIGVHHLNEIAQTKASSGKQLARIFAHSEHLLVKGRKMSKSLGNAFVLGDILAKGYRARDLRYFLLSGDWRQKLNFTWEGLKSAQQTLMGIERLKTNKPEKVKLKKARQILFNNLNMPRLLAFLHQQKNFWLWQKMEDVLALNLREAGENNKRSLTARQRELLARRLKLRQSGKFAQADKIRRQLEGQGVKVIDPSV